MLLITEVVTGLNKFPLAFFSLEMPLWSRIAESNADLSFSGSAIFLSSPSIDEL